jgi:FAD/FMN-containing dehydrogenase
VQPGATLAELDKAAQEHGLATPVGINSTTGIAGLTLGGGFGWLTRKYGMTVDNLVSANVVTAGGDQVRASEMVNPDLFWALRGGGGNFGVVTEFEFRLHPVGPEVTAGLIVFPLEEAVHVLGRYRDFVAMAPEELTVWAVMRHAPPLPFLPAHVHGKRVLVLAVCYTGELQKAEKLVAPLRRFGHAVGEHIGTVPYAQWQQAFDPLLTTGARNYWKSHNFAKLADSALAALVDYANGLATDECEVFVAHIAGAANRIAPAAMAYGHRDAEFVVNVHARWREASQDPMCILWARRVFQGLAPYASSGAYVNFMTEDEANRVASAYGANHARLAQLKARYDPQNVFHTNQNIKPAD